MAVAALLALTGCAKEGPTVAELQSQVDDLKSKLAAAKVAADAVDTDITDLQAKVGDFDRDEWKAVVPEMRSASDKLDTDALDLMAALGCSRGNKCR
jgi:outer membrane murein-binding lipoprotein Lpp